MVTIMDGGTASIEGEDILNNHCKSASSLHHNLEKLQQSHDELLHQVEAEKVANSKLRSEMEEMKSRNSKMENSLEAKDCETRELRETIETMRRQFSEMQENVAKTDKIKMLAVKLKKDLAQAKDEVEKSRSSENQAKEQLKTLQKDHEKMTVSYQQAIRNFQNLQAEYDKIQDEYDQCKAGAKSVNSDLTNSVTELGKAKEELAHKMMEADTLTARVNSLVETLTETEEKCKELEGTVIILRSELSTERKKVTAGIGLEKCLEDYKNQLDIQSNTISSLEEKLEKYKSLETEYNSLRPEYQAVCEQVHQLTKETADRDEQITKLEKRLEHSNSSLEEERIKCSELISEKAILESKLSSMNADTSSRVKHLEEKISSLTESLSLLEEELRIKENDFDAYKARVTKVLNQAKQSTKESEEMKTLKENHVNLEARFNEREAQWTKLSEEKVHLEIELRQVNKERDDLVKEMKRLDRLTEDNLKLKNLARDLQGRLVLERENKEKEMGKKETENGLIVQALRQEISDLKTKITYLEDELTSYQAQLEGKKGTDVSNESSALCSNCKSLSSLAIQQSSPIPSTCDYNSHYLDHHVNHHHQHPLHHQASSSSGQVNDLSRESIETNSPTTLERRRERLSSCSSSIQSHVNPLHEILNSKDDGDDSSMTNHFSSSHHPLSSHLDYIEMDDLKKRLNDLTQLLEESESNNALLVEQNRVLKEEIRRMQRSIDRADLVQNMEYLKNILVKFVSCNSDRIQLVPVLKTILKLSKSEEDLFVKVCL